MRIPAFADVCLRVLMLLGGRAGEQMTSRDIAEAIGVPYNHVSKAVLELRRRGAVDVVRGRHGGVLINETGLSLSVGAFLRSLDEDRDIVDCTREDGSACPLIGACLLRGAFNRAREAFYAELDGVHVRDLTGPQGRVVLQMPMFRGD